MNGRGAVANEEQAVAPIGRVVRGEQLLGFVSADVRMVVGDRLRLSEQSFSVLLKELSEGLHLKQIGDRLLEIMGRLVERWIHHGRCLHSESLFISK